MSSKSKKQAKQAQPVPDEISYLRYYVVHLVRIWTALQIIRGTKSDELIRVFQDLCSDKLRNMLHELANKRTWTSYGLKKVAAKEWPQMLYKCCAKHNVFLEWEKGKPEPNTPCHDALPVRRNFSARKDRLRGRSLRIVQVLLISAYTLSSPSSLCWYSPRLNRRRCRCPCRYRRR